MEYEDYVMQNITQPLGMNATFFATPPVMAALAVGTMTYPNGSRGPAPIVDNGWPTPAGGLLATSRYGESMRLWLMP